MSRAASVEATTVSSVCSFDGWLSRTVTALAPPFSVMTSGDTSMLAVGAPSSSRISICTAAGAATPLPPLAAVLARAGSPKTAEAGAQREKLKRWFWCAVFGQVYEGAPNSKAAKDVVEILPWLSGGNLPESVASFSFDPRALRDVTARQRAIYRGANCLILGARAPSDYLAEIRDTPGFPFEEVLASHGLPAGADSPLLRDNYEQFLLRRQERLWQEIGRVTGATVAADLEADDKDLE